MNTQEYIASGILEEYLMHTCSPQERQEVECLSKIYPEIKQELETLELALEQYAMQSAVKPPTAVWDNILSDIETETESAATAAPAMHVLKDEPETSENKTPHQPQKTQVWRYAAAIALFVTSALTLVFYQGKQRAEEAYQQQQQVVTGIEDKNQLLQIELNEQQKIVEAISLPETKRILLKGIETKAPGKSAWVVFNTLTQEVYLNQGTLPPNPSGKQYQLWALKDGKPIDLGVFDVSDKTAFIAMKSIDGAQAFAITLEDAGGKPTPNLEELYVIGELG